MKIQVTSAFGYYTSSNKLAKTLKGNENWDLEKGPFAINTQTSFKRINITNMIAYIPIISTIMGIFRLVVSINAYNLAMGASDEYGWNIEKIAKPLLVSHICKAIIELTSITPILFVIDMIATIARIHL